MTKIFVQLVGLVLLLIGIKYLGSNILFTSTYYRYSWQTIPAAGSAIAVVAGVISLVFFRRQTGNLGWIFLMIGIVLVFISGGVLLKPTSLWDLFIGLLASAVGYQFLTEGRWRI